MRRPIALSLSPNTELDDVLLAIKMLFLPWKWKRGQALQKIGTWFSDIYPEYAVYNYNSGRSALYEVIKALSIGKGDEVLLQAFTCVAVPNAIIWNSATPIYCDIEPGTFNIDPEEIEKKITNKTKAIIVQHTFGIPANIVAIKKLARKHNLFLIEDCAHSLGGTVEGKRLGSYGDAAVFSFGRDKVVSSVFGGVGIIHKKLKNQNVSNQTSYDALSTPSMFWVFQQLLHPVLFNLIILPLYNTVSIGKLLLFIFQKFRVLSFPVEKLEGSGMQPDIYPKLYPNALAVLALLQLGKLERYKKHRKDISQIYGRSIKNAVYLRYPMHTENRDQLVETFKSNKIVLGNWYSNVVDPTYVDYHAVNYKIGTCAIAEHAARTIINLPTYPGISKQDARRIQKLIH